MFFHIDAVQGAGKVAFDVRRFGCHLCSISAHKMHGPKGVGAMYVRRGTPLEPLIVGGSHERRQRAGTENVPGIVGLGKAAELAMECLADGTIERVAALRDRLEAGVLGIAGTGVNGAGRTARGQHHQYPFRAGGGRGAGDRARPEGRRGERRVGVPLRLDRAQPCADGDGPGQECGAGEFALQLAEDRDRSGCGSCVARGSGGRGAFAGAGTGGWTRGRLLDS